MMKKYLLLILLLLMAIGGIPDSCFGQTLFPGCISVSTVPPTYYEDTFDYTAGDLGGVGDWTVGDNADDIQCSGSGTVRPNGDASEEIGARNSSRTYSNNQYAYTVYSATYDGEFLGPAVRVSSDARTYYGFYIDADTWYVMRCASGTYNQIATGSATISSGDTLYIEINGTTLIAKLNGSTMYSGTQSDISSGNPGLSGYGVNSTHTFVTYWRGGDL